jgi:hypothetical protein
MPSSLTILHLVTYPILLIPLIPLARAPGQPRDELPGIRPIKVQVITPRRGLILTLLCALAFTSVLDATILVIDLLSGPHHTIEWYEDIELLSWVVYTFGGFVIWSLAAILAEWRTKWGDKSVSAMGAFAFVFEVANLALLVLREIHTGESRHTRRLTVKGRADWLQMDRERYLRYYPFHHLVYVYSYYSLSLPPSAILG